MTLTIRKIIVIALLAAVFIGANIVLIANWLAEKGIEEKAGYLIDNFLTGTALTVIVALLILLVSPQNGTKPFGIARTCPVCDKQVSRKANYCPECGSKI